MRGQQQEYIDAVAALQRLPEDQQRKWLEAFADQTKFAAASLQVRDKDGVLVPLVMRASQRKLIALANRQMRTQGYVRIIAGKARQVMVSTATAALFWQHCAFQAGRKAMVFAHTEDAAKNLFDYYDTFHKHYRQFGPFALPSLESDTDRRLKYSNDSVMQCFTAGNPDALNSFRATCIHFSEFALYERAAAMLHNANGTLPLRPGTMMIIESTARGRNEFHNLVQRARGGKSHWALYFFGWHEHDEYQTPIPTSIEAYQRSLTPDEVQLQRDLRLTFEQIEWRRRKLDEFNGNVDMFKQEFPSNIDEAFIGTGRTYFHPPIVQRAYFPIAGDVGKLEQVEGGRRPLVRLVPDRFGDVTVFKRPERGRVYACGADPARGADPSMVERRVSDPDFLAAHIVDCDSGEQVAKLHVRCTAIEGGRRVADLCRWYGYAYLQAEANDPAFIQSLVEDGYPQELIAPRDRTADVVSAPARSILELGWLTNERSRRELIGILETCLIDGSLVIRDEATYSELLSFVVKANGRAEHDSGCHDDLVFALALACDAMRRAKPVFANLDRLRDRQSAMPKSQPISMYGRPRRPDFTEVDDISPLPRRLN